MSLQMGPIVPLGPNVNTDETFITLGSSYYTSAFYNSESGDSGFCVVNQSNGRAMLGENIVIWKTRINRFK